MPPRRPPPSRLRPAPRPASTLGFEILILAGALAAAWAAPRWIAGQGALEWVRYHAVVRPDVRPVERARQLGRKAARAIGLLAPLPPAAEAAHMAQAVARELLDQRPSDVLLVAQPIRATLDEVCASRWRRYGLAEDQREFSRLMDAARAKSLSPRPEASPAPLPSPAPSPRA